MAVCQTTQRHLSYGEDRLAFGSTAIAGAEFRNPRSNLRARKLAFRQRGSKYIAYFSVYISDLLAPLGSTAGV
jgi:hypothetical protein